jgi:hypothetical protein
MPIQYEIERDVLVVEMRGQITLQEFATYLSETSRDPRYRTDLSRLVLIREAATFPASSEIVAIAGQMPSRGLPANVRFACVATSLLAVGIASMFMGNAGLSNNYQLFSDEKTARAWLEA